jgi:hypothetical protein
LSSGSRTPSVFATAISPITSTGGGGGGNYNVGGTQEVQEVEVAGLPTGILTGGTGNTPPVSPPQGNSGGNGTFVSAEMQVEEVEQEQLELQVLVQLEVQEEQEEQVQKI